MSDESNPYESLKADSGSLRPLSFKVGPIDLRELFVVTAIIATLMAFILPVIRDARGPTRSMQCKNNLKNVILALHNYASRNDGRFPPAYTVDAEGRPLHSWRTLILYDIDRRDLADRIDFAKPWDDPVNAELGKTYVSVYSCPEAENYSNLTTYLAVAGPNAFLNATEPRDMRTIDNPGDTIGVIDMGSSQAVPWMSPQDTDEHTVLSLGRSITFAHTGGTNIAHPDGSVGFLNEDTSTSERHKMISIAGE